jgi:hypothetical protein
MGVLDEIIGTHKFIEHMTVIRITPEPGTIKGKFLLRWANITSHSWLLTEL